MPAATLDASTSPARKLSRLAESRNLWKQKYKLLMTRCRVLENQVRAVEASREHWRQVAQQAIADAAQKKVKSSFQPTAGN